MICVFLQNMSRFVIYVSVAGFVFFSPTACVNNPASEQAKSATRAASLYEIKMQSRTFTPEAGVPGDLADRIKHVIDQERPDKARAHIMVQLNDPPGPEDIDRYAGKGLTLLEPLNGLIWYAAVTLRASGQLSELKGVRWAELIEPRDKISGWLLKNPEPLPYHLRPDSRVAYSVMFHKDVAADEIKALARRINVKLENFDANAYPVVRSVNVVVTRGGLEALAAVDIIAWIEPFPPPELDQNRHNAQPMSNVNIVRSLLPYNLDGTGVSVGIWEAKNIVYEHRDLKSRVYLQPGQTSTPDNHSTGVAGTIGASGVNFPEAEGMAPRVNICSWDHHNDTNEMTNATALPCNTADPNPLRISNHSYAADPGWDSGGLTFCNDRHFFGMYNNVAYNFDNVVFEKDLIVFRAAGNNRNDMWMGGEDREVAPHTPRCTSLPSELIVNVPARDCRQSSSEVDADCISPPGTAKNVITVGAMMIDGTIAELSGFGPTDDRRIKPDLMAQGEVKSTLAYNPLDGIRGMTGTSISTPVASGVAALVLQEARERKITMTASSMRALLIQTAQDVKDTGQSREGPDFATGWGIVDAKAAVTLLRQHGLAQGTVSATGIGNAWIRTFYVPAGQTEIHVTLAWTDPPGNYNDWRDPNDRPYGPKLVNDLDLRLIAPDNTAYRPWTLDLNDPAQGADRNGGNDAVNNVEQVSVNNPTAGMWKVRVSASKLDPRPGYRTQAFAVAGLLHSDVMLVMDRSGSMRGQSAMGGVTKLMALQNAANEFIDLMVLGGAHRLGLVQFEENVVPNLPPFDLQPLTPDNVGNAHNAVNSMVADGWTNIIAGVNAAAGQLGPAGSPLPRRAIVLFSDGRHNRPDGSDINDISATVQAGDYWFYSIGYGTDVDDDVLPSVAANSGGIHLNEQDLSPIQLIKYFLTVGALINEMAVISDPAYRLGRGESARLPVNISKLDQSVTFAVNWTGEHAGDVKLALLAPDERCRIPLKDHKGLRMRKGKNYRLVRVDLPYDCSGLEMHEGRWAIRVMPAHMSSAGKETVDIMILGDSRLKLEAKSTLGEKGRQLILTARFLQDGKLLDKAGEARVEANILVPLPHTGDSEKQDAFRKDKKPVEHEKSRKERRMKTVKLFDNGNKGDFKAGDGIFRTTIDISDMKPGLLQVRMVATLKNGSLELTREATTSFYVRR